MLCVHERKPYLEPPGLENNCALHKLHGYKLLFDLLEHLGNFNDREEQPDVCACRYFHRCHQGCIFVCDRERRRSVLYVQHRVLQERGSIVRSTNDSRDALERSREIANGNGDNLSHADAISSASTASLCAFL